MFFKTSVILAVLLGSTFVSAHPVRRQPGADISVRLGRRAENQTFGAAYFITNEADRNFVVAADIGQDGKLTLRQATSTGGIGSHGLAAGLTNGTDPLFSQGSIVVSQASNMLATVNPGSNSVTLFKIDPANPTALKRLGNPAPSGGEFPIAVAFNKAGNMLCAVNGGKVNGVGCFKVNSQQGLTPIEGSIRSLNVNQTTPPEGPAGTVSNLVFSEDDKQVMAVVKGSATAPGVIAVWDIAEDGSLSEKFTPLSGAAPGTIFFTLTALPGKNASLVADAGVGFQVVDFKTGKFETTKVEGSKAVCWSSFSAQTGNAYLTDIGTSLVTEVNVDDKLKGTVVKQYPLGANSSTIDNSIASIAGTDFLYVLSAGASAVDVLSLKGGAGAAAKIQTLDVAAPAKRSGLKLESRNLQGMATFVMNVGETRDTVIFEDAVDDFQA